MNEKLSRSEQSRINGARSKGPKTREGKLRSSMNHFIHGRRSQYFTVLKEEDQSAFLALRTDLVRALRPANPLERRLVNELASIEWRLQRLAMMETAVLDHECRFQRVAVQPEEPDPDPGVIVSLAAHNLVEHSRLPAYLGNHAAQLIYQREAAFRYLRYLRDTTPPFANTTQTIHSTPLNAKKRAPNKPHSNPRQEAPAEPLPSVPEEPVTP